jgi:hypothetical protein
MSQVAYWVVGLFAVLQFFTGLSMKGFWAWILRFSLAIVLWSACWFVIAKLHNMLSTETWLSGNYAWTQGVEILSGLTKLVSVLWHDSSASFLEKIITAFQQAHQAIIWHQPDLGLVWLLADTTRNYVPDYAELIQSGFMVKNPDNSIALASLGFDILI